MCIAHTLHKLIVCKTLRWQSYSHLKGIIAIYNPVRRSFTDDLRLPLQMTAPCAHLAHRTDESVKPIGIASVNELCVICYFIVCLTKDKLWKPMILFLIMATKSEENEIFKTDEALDNFFSSLIHSTRDDSRLDWCTRLGVFFFKLLHL